MSETVSHSRKHLYRKYIRSHHSAQASHSIRRQEDGSTGNIVIMIACLELILPRKSTQGGLFLLDSTWFLTLFLFYSLFSLFASPLQFFHCELLHYLNSKMEKISYVLGLAQSCLGNHSDMELKVTPFSFPFPLSFMMITTTTTTMNFFILAGSCWAGFEDRNFRAF